jgi:hypothetical protein
MTTPRGDYPHPSLHPRISWDVGAFQRPCGKCGKLVHISKFARARGGKRINTCNDCRSNPK